MISNRKKVKVGKEFVNKVKKLVENKGLQVIFKNNSYFPDLDCIFHNERIGIECKYLTDFKFLIGIINQEKKKVKDRKIILLGYGNSKTNILFVELFCPIEKRKKLQEILKLLNSCVNRH